MDFLLDNPLATLNGAVFLILYAFVIFFTIASLALYRSEIDKTDKLNLPAIPPNPDPYEIAYLRGGVNEMARSAVFSLIQKGFVEVVNEGKTGKVKRVENSVNHGSLNQIEQLALNWIGKEREAKDVFNEHFGLVEKLEPSGLIYHGQLEGRQFLTTYETESRIKWWGRRAAALVGVFGAYKIIAAIVHGQFNFIFTIILAVVGIGIALTISRLPRMTKLGKIYLERLQLAFETLKYKSQEPYIGTIAPRTATAGEAGFAGVDPLLVSVGVFGTGILAGTIFSNYNDAFAKAKQQQAGSSGGCGAGCGSSCSSGGDGGGSSCGGGGCGGCGGGCS
jgi:uncharacterized protein (TIGR04222 family)